MKTLENLLRATLILIFLVMASCINAVLQEVISSPDDVILRVGES